MVERRPPLNAITDYGPILGKFNTHGDEPERILMRVEFTSGQVYHSYWDNGQQTAVTRATEPDPGKDLGEMDMEMLVTERLCQLYFDPAMQGRPTP